MGIFAQTFAHLSSEEQAARYHQLATVALPNYALTDAIPLVMQHNSGITYRVTTRNCDADFVLKVHDPVGQGHAAPASRIEARMNWLAELGQTASLHIQDPIRGRNGTYVTSAHLPLMTEPVACTLQQWVDGDHPDGDFTPTQMGLVGASMAQLHGYSATHPALPSEAAEEDLQQAVQRLEAAIALNLLSSTQYQLLVQVKQVLLTIADKLGRDGSVWGPIHGDIHHSNVLFREDAIAIIDFDSLYTSYYLLDLGTTLYHILYQDVSIRQRFIDSYMRVRTLSPAHLLYLEAFVTWAALTNLAFQLTIPEQRISPYFARNLQQVADFFCPHVLTGQPFVTV
jgi:Ser/Thr protein kinase RdoA (MazF antagonist)